MNKSDAAKYLDIGVRSLERYTSQGRIAAHSKRGKTGMVADYDEGDLQRLKVELSDEETSATIAIQPATSPSVATSATALARLPSQSSSQLARTESPSPASAKAAPDARQVAPKLLWTMDEAALMTGISKQRLRAAIEAGELKAGRVGRAFRVRPDDVREWINGLY